MASSFLSAIGAIYTGLADVAVGTKQEWITGNTDEIDYIPLVQRQSDMVIRKEDSRTPEFQAILQVLHDPAFQSECGALGGVNVDRMGEIMME